MNNEWNKDFVISKELDAQMHRYYGDFDGCPEEVKKIARRPAYQYTELEAGKLGKSNVH